MPHLWTIFPAHDMRSVCHSSRIREMSRLSLSPVMVLDKPISVDPCWTAIWLIADVIPLIAYVPMIKPIELTSQPWLMINYDKHVLDVDLLFFRFIAKWTWSGSVLTTTSHQPEEQPFDDSPHTVHHHEPWRWPVWCEWVPYSIRL